MSIWKGIDVKRRFILEQEEEYWPCLTVGVDEIRWGSLHAIAPGGTTDTQAEGERKVNDSPRPRRKIIRAESREEGSGVQCYQIQFARNVGRARSHISIARPSPRGGRISERLISCVPTLIARLACSNSWVYIW